MHSETPFEHNRLLELAASYAEYSVLVTTAQLDLPGPQILYVNSAFTRMTGYAISELLGKTPRILQGEETNRETLDQILETLSSGNDFVGRAINYKRDGSPFQLEWIISHLRDENGQTTHYIAVQRDITGQNRAERDLQRFDEEMKEASKQLIASAHRLEQAESHLVRKNRFAVMGEMTAGMVHDISNALTPVFGLVQELHQLENLPVQAKRYTANLDSSIEHAIGVLTNLKSYYTEGTNRPKSQIALQSLFHRIPEITRAKWWNDSRQTENSINFAFNLNAASRVLGNETELLQVFVNLVFNALEAMPDGGTITLALKEEAEAAVSTIQDNGKGMASEIMDRCFEPYISTRSNGTGLGLSVCRRIIEEHGGTISMTAVEPHGVCCTIRLPLATNDEAADSQTPLEGVRALLVSSDPVEQGKLSELLQSLGLETIIAVSGDEALQRFFEAPTDLAIAGTHLSDVAKYDLTRTIKKKDDNVRIIHLSPSSNVVSKSWSGHAQPDEILTGSVTADSLTVTLRKLGLLSD